MNLGPLTSIFVPAPLTSSRLAAAWNIRSGLAALATGIAVILTVPGPLANGYIRVSETPGIIFTASKRDAEFAVTPVSKASEMRALN